MDEGFRLPFVRDLVVVLALAIDPLGNGVVVFWSNGKQGIDYDDDEKEDDYEDEDSRLIWPLNGG